MKIEQITLAPALDNFIASCSSIQTNNLHHYTSRSYGFPEATPELIILLEGHFDIWYKEKHSRISESFVLTYTDKPTLVIPSNKLHMVKVTFHPLGVYPVAKITRTPAKELVGTPIFLAKDLLGHTIQTLELQLHGGKNMAPLISKYFLTKLNSIRSSRKDQSMEKALNSGNYYRVDQLCNYLNCTPRTLQRWFSANLDISPKMYLRLLRFKKVLSYLSSHGQEKTDYLSIALQHGFYDQNHLIKEIKLFTNNTPEILPLDNYHFKQLQ